MDRFQNLLAAEIWTKRFLSKTDITWQEFIELFVPFAKESNDIDISNDSLDYIKQYLDS